MSSCSLAIRVIPRASREEVSGERGDSITIRLTAAPVKGAANKALLAFLGKRLGVPKSALSIVGGETSRDKRLHVEGLDETTARALLLGEN
ncbi:MAG: DUF167 domain-containing protein [Armatimonadia bacterium]